MDNVEELKKQNKRLKIANGIITAYVIIFIIYHAVHIIVGYLK